MGTNPNLQQIYPILIHVSLVLLLWYEVRASKPFRGSIEHGIYYARSENNVHTFFLSAQMVNCIWSAWFSLHLTCANSTCTELQLYYARSAWIFRILMTRGELTEEDLHIFDLRPLLSQNTSPDQIPLLRFWSKIHIRFLQRACMKNWIKFYWLRSQYFNSCIY